MKARFSPGVLPALLAALLFGVSTPLSKNLVGTVPPFLLAGLLYAGSGLGLSLVWLARRRLAQTTSQEAGLSVADVPWLLGAILAGGVAGPVLLLYGLTRTPSSTAALLLNLEGMFTALLAWWVFRESVDRRIALGMLAILLGGVILSWEGIPQAGNGTGIAAITGACLAWGIDNNLTRKVSGADPIQVVSLKGLIAGSVNIGIALGTGHLLPSPAVMLQCALLGLCSYGVSLALFVYALRQLGAARTGAYFSVAPFFGALAAILLLSEPVTPALVAAALCMALGTWLHLSEEHAHEHTHEPMEHEHLHVHDAHHQHSHPGQEAVSEPHSHIHTHAPVRHVHAHFPDLHHRHEH